MLLSSCRCQWCSTSRSAAVRRGLHAAAWLLLPQLMARSCAADTLVLPQPLRRVCTFLAAGAAASPAAGFVGPGRGPHVCPRRCLLLPAGGGAVGRVGWLLSLRSLAGAAAAFGGASRAPNAAADSTCRVTGRGCVVRAPRARVWQAAAPAGWGRPGQSAGGSDGWSSFCHRSRCPPSCVSTETSVSFPFSLGDFYRSRN